MAKLMPARWIVFAITVPISLYVSFFGTVFMGFCPGIECLPYNYAWILIAPCLLLAIVSLRVTAVAATLLLITHVFQEVISNGGGLNPNTLWGADKGLDICLWIVVLLLAIAALLPKKPVAQE